MAERIVNVTGGQGAADGDVDRVDGRQGNQQGEHDVCHPVPVVAPGDHDEPQRGQGQQVKGLPGSGFICRPGGPGRSRHGQHRRLSPAGGRCHSWSSAFHRARQPTKHISHSGWPRPVRAGIGGSFRRPTHYERVLVRCSRVQIPRQLHVHGCCWWRPLAVDGGSGTSRGRPWSTPAGLDRPGAEGIKRPVDLGHGCFWFAR
jgi:hypothetical protein